MALAAGNAFILDVQAVLTTARRAGVAGGAGSGTGASTARGAPTACTFIFFIIIFIIIIIGAADFGSLVSAPAKLIGF